MTVARVKTTQVVTEKESIEIAPIKRVFLQVPIIGDTPLICSAIGEAAKKALRDSYAPGPKAKKSKERDPNQEFLDAQYRLDDGRYAMKAAAVKRAMEGVAPEFGITKVDVARKVRVPAELIPLELEGDPWMQEDTVRNQNAHGALVLVYRPYFFPWKMTVPIRIKDVPPFTVEQVINLLEHAGNDIGIGAWRPDKKGEMGTFHIDRSNIEVLYL